MHIPSRALVVFAAVTTLGACNDPAPTDGDGGLLQLVDSGPVMPDTGPAIDAARPDAGGGLCADLSAMFGGTPELPASCLPRCTAETHAAVIACGSDEACAQAALDADPTPPIMVGTHFGPQVVGCGRPTPLPYPCPLWQSYSCYEDFCRAQYYAYADCHDAGGVCTAEQAAIDACIAASADATACMRDRVAACFP